MTDGDEVPLDRQILRCWVELRDLHNGATRKLPITCVQKICLTREKQSGVTSPDRFEIHVQDGAHTWIAADVSDLSAQLRTQYPDHAFERLLKCERDLEAEKRREAAIDKLAEIMARAAVDEYLKESS